MTTKIKTCGHCAHMALIEVKDLVGRIAVCDLTMTDEGGYKVVPQQSRFAERVTHFRRVPMWCPRPASEVGPTEKPRKRWRDWSAVHWDTGEVETMRGPTEAKA